MGVKMDNNDGLFREGVAKKGCCSFGFCLNQGGGSALSKFLSPFRKCIFGQEKESISSKMPII